MLSVILELVRYLLPSLVVFATIYFLLNKLFYQQMHSDIVKQKGRQKERIDGIKMQAYERLILFCERIDPKQLFLRLNTGVMSAKQMQEAMLVGIQQEYEHNYTQQLYVSQNLWKIITLAKDHTSNLIAQVGDNLSSDDPPVKLIEYLTRVQNEINISPLDQAKHAIKNEIDLILQ